MIDLLAEDMTITIPTVAITGIATIILKNMWDNRRRKNFKGINGMDGKTGKAGKNGASLGDLDEKLEKKYVRKDIWSMQNQDLVKDLKEVRDDIKEVRKSQALTNISLAEITIILKQKNNK